MIIGITGANGFIGQRLVQKHLEQGDTVRILSRQTNPGTPERYNNSVETYIADLLTCNSDTLLPFIDGVDVLYHCAGELINEKIMYDLHVTGTRKLVNAASGKIRRWVQLSSVGVYGLCKHGIVTEEFQMNPIGLYEKTKAAADNIILDAGTKSFFETVILRPSNIFGKTMRNQSLFQLINIINRGIFFYTGNKNAYVNYIHVDNVIEALIHCANNKKAHGHIFIISDHLPLPEFIKKISTCLERPEPGLNIPYVPVWMIAVLMGWIPGFPLTRSRIRAMNNYCVYSDNKIRTLLGYHEKISLSDGIEELVLYWKENQ